MSSMSHAKANNDSAVAEADEHRTELPVVAEKLDYYEEREYRGNGNEMEFLPCHRSVFGGFTDPMAVERREIVGNFKSLASILARSDFS